MKARPISRIVVKLSRVLILMFVTIATLTITPSAFGQIEVAEVRVDGDSGLTVGQGATGADWDHAYKYLQDGITGALALFAGLDPPDRVEIWVKGDDDTDGIIYYPDEGFGLTDNDDTLSFELHEDVRILCGFAGGETDLNARNSAVYKVVLSGDIDQDGLDGDNSRHVVRADFVDATAWIDGATITGGFADGSGEDAFGGGIRILGGDTIASGDVCMPAILRCRFTGNIAAKGGAAYIRSSEMSTVVFRNCTFDNNSAGSGAAIEVSEINQVGGACKLQLINCQWFENVAADGPGAVISSTMFVDTEIRSGTAAQNSSSEGAAIHRIPYTGEGEPRSGKMEVRSSIVWDNFNPGSPPNTDLAAQIDDGVRPVDLRNSCVMDLGTEHSGYGNIDDDPLFVDAGSNDFQLECDSPAINKGNDVDVTLDAYDLLQNGPEATDNPDLTNSPARRVQTMDMGAYERQQSKCCPADIVEDNNTVNINDLLAVIIAWGSCVGGGECNEQCPADISPQPSGDGTVGINDLLAVIINWGECPEECATGEPNLLGMSIEMSECLADCDLTYEWGTEAWWSCVSTCQSTWGQ